MEPEIKLLPSSVARRRRRNAALLGAVVALLLGTAALVLWGLRTGPQPITAVVRAAEEIKPGTRITTQELGTTDVYAQDPSVLTTLVGERDRGSLIGRVALVDVPAGALVPAGVAVSEVAAGMWKAAVPIKRAPADLHAGDHVAVLAQATANGQDVDAVVMQDVVVLDVGSGSADLWLPARSAPQIEWYADHGGLVLLAMKPGTVQSQLPTGGSSP